MLYIYIYIYIYTCVRTTKQIYIYIYIYIYTYTHIYTHISPLPAQDRGPLQQLMLVSDIVNRPCQYSMIYSGFRNAISNTCFNTCFKMDRLLAQTKPYTHLGTVMQRNAMKRHMLGCVRHTASYAGLCSATCRVATAGEVLHGTLRLYSG